LKVLLVGSGGREDALAWALSRSPKLTRLCCAPGNGGTIRYAESVAIGAEDVGALVDHAVREHYDLVVVGPETPLVDGLADRLESAGVVVFGPSADAAQLEGSKIFSKLFMQRHGIPTASFQVFSDLGEAQSYLESPATRYPLVVKADGLAAGKGVVLADDRETALTAAKGMLSGRDFGDAGRRILVEEMLSGREASFFVLSDGKRFVELATCQDYKRANDGDRGLNTGGMGAYSPSVWLDDATRQTLIEKVVRPAIEGLAAEGMPYRGVLYTGVMLTEDGPQVLEFNARFGDPETQVLMPRLDGDWLDLLYGAARGELGDAEPAWKNEAAVCVVMASGGYPGEYAKGHRIEGLEQAEALGAVVFHAGTRREDDGYVTSGGRVLGVTALGGNLEAARRNAYAAVDEIRWSGEEHRNDIALDAVLRRDR
jgi:phosphoribosylamine--glycine ligase